MFGRQASQAVLSRQHHNCMGEAMTAYALCDCMQRLSKTLLLKAMQDLKQQLLCLGRRLEPSPALQRVPVCSLKTSRVSVPLLSCCMVQFTMLNKVIASRYMLSFSADMLSCSSCPYKDAQRIDCCAKTRLALHAP